ncbi:MAG: undecaprenyl-phosphate glucose phosphotransferase [Candidatus Tectomicrobia bacterium]|nr:undecaprenyl-phosphate glucose phosphotransferase [Candidatus Tectomicrobia bacterium]
MLRQHSQFFSTLMFLGDLLIAVGAWIGAYELRFATPLVPLFHPEETVPPLAQYLYLLIYLVPIWAVVLHYGYQYQSRRTTSIGRELASLTRQIGLGMLALLAVTFLDRRYSYSRVAFAFFGVLCLGGMSLYRLAFRAVLREMRRRGMNLRYVVIVGAGKLGREIARRLNAHPELGFKIVGFFTRRLEKVKTFVDTIEVLGTYEEVGSFLKRFQIDQVILALPLEAYERIEGVLRSIGDAPVDIRVAPDLLQYRTMRGSVEEFEGIPFVNLQETPLVGWSRLLKRLADLLVAGLGLLLLAPLFGVIAIAIKLSSPGRVIYRQERMGLDGTTFTMLKFRSMRERAEEATGAVWATPDDQRRTRVGAWLRRFSLDELPQLMNVLRGEMSIVGPRPERPVFVEKFRQLVPQYMLRHKVKSGMTGWAQINGWRGNTSLERRITYDLYYIEHWSLWFDLRIIAMTVWRCLAARDAY